MEQVSANVYAETCLGGCNPGFVTTKDGIVMIDSPQIPSDAIHWRNEMKNKGEIRYLINTEPHRDHIAGNFFFPGKRSSSSAKLSCCSLEGWLPKLSSGCSGTKDCCAGISGTLVSAAAVGMGAAGGGSGDAG